MHGSARWALVAGLVVWGAAFGQPAPVGTSGPVPSKPEQAVVPAPDPISSAEQLLDALQTADRDLVSLKSDVKWDRTFEIQGDQQSRLGKLYYVVSKPAEGGQPP